MDHQRTDICHMITSVAVSVSGSVSVSVSVSVSLVVTSTTIYNMFWMCSGDRFNIDRRLIDDKKRTANIRVMWSNFNCYLFSSLTSTCLLFIWNLYICSEDRIN